MDNYARHTKELLYQVVPPQSASGTPTLTVPVGPVELGLQKLLTPAKLLAQNQQELMADVQKNLQASLYAD